MDKKPNKRRDFSQVAFNVVQQATGEAAPMPEPTARQLNRAKGGKVGGKARADKLTPEQRSEIAKKAAQTRWAKK